MARFHETCEPRFVDSLSNKFETRHHQQANRIPTKTSGRKNFAREIPVRFYETSFAPAKNGAAWWTSQSSDGTTEASYLQYSERPPWHSSCLSPTSSQSLNMTVKSHERRART
jgi:hypothetical protein